MSEQNRLFQQALAQPFAPEDLEWRLQNVNKEKMRGMAVPYVTNRAIQNRLDEVCGPDNWYNDYKPWHGNGKKDAQLCGIAIYFEGKGFITKWDGAEDSDIEPIKGGLSDSMKRAANQWGIGRVLYSLDTVWVDVERRGNSFIIKDSERTKLDKVYLNTLSRLGLKPSEASGIQALLTEKPSAEELSEKPQVPKLVAPITQKKEAATTSTTRQATIHILEGGESVKQSEESYVVREIRLQNGMNGVNTWLRLDTPEHKHISAFVRGMRSELVVGAHLTDVKLTLRKQDTVVFYVLESFRVTAPCPQAA